ncbi:MAG: MBL fold metallo-hydrolase, partial [Solirubrobacteraceae bacterium]
ELTIGDVRVRAVPAVHGGRRSPLSGPAEAVGFIAEGSHRVYFAGDTERFEGMADLAPLDVALLPIWGWGPSLGAGHMDPEQAARATALLSPRIVVPVHWGTFLPVGMAGRHADLLREPPRTFAARVAELAPGSRVEILQPGGSLVLDGR